jgi:biopolymer transport protein ExbB/TolQ
MLMKTFINISIPIVLTISLVLLLNTGSSNIYGQNMTQTNQTNQTSGQNTTQQAQQQLDQANQQIQQAQQQKQQAQQQLEQSNQTQSQQGNQSKQQQDPKMNEKLLNYTNVAILALNENDPDTAQDSLVQIQNALINASGKQVVVVPAPAVPSNEEDSD